MMNAMVLVNRLAEVGPRQTTTMLAARLAARGIAVWLVEVQDWVAGEPRDSGEFSCRGISLADLGAGVTFPELARWAASEPPKARLELRPRDLVWIRTNPGRDRARENIHHQALARCSQAQAAGLVVVNDPAGAAHWAAKGALLELPEGLVPPMCVSSDGRELQKFFDDAPGACVLKPTVGSRGEGVIRVERGDTGWFAWWQQQPAQQWVAQHFVDSDQPGDLRVVVLGGALLESAGQVAGMARLPQAGDFRGNLHAGGSAAPLRLTSRQRQVAGEAANELHRWGVWLAGVDLVGDQIIELNVFSTGGLFPAQELTGIDFASIVVERLMTDFRLT